MCSRSKINHPVNSKQIINIQVPPSTQHPLHTLRNSLSLDKDSPNSHSWNVNLKIPLEQSRTPGTGKQHSPLRNKMLRIYREKRKGLWDSVENRQNHPTLSGLHNDAVELKEQLAALKFELAQVKLENKSLKGETKALIRMEKALVKVSEENLELKQNSSWGAGGISSKLSTAMNTMKNEIRRMVSN